MSDRRGTDPDAETAISLAETFLEHHRKQLSSDLGAKLEKEIEQWQSRREGLDEDDDLYELATERIRENKKKLEQLQTDTEDVEEELLTMVASGFTAKGKWLDPSLLRALNLIFFDKYSESFVVNRQVLDADTSLDDDEIYGVSKAVRDLASQQLGGT